MKDLELRGIVERALEFEPSIDAADIGIAVENGVVTLTGHVASLPQKFTAERVVLGVKGVRAIAQKIEVRVGPDGQPTDEEIATRALNSLAWDVVVPNDKIQVKVQKGWVTLTGKVNWNFQRTAAEHSVRKLTGVLGVNNQILIQPTVKAGDVKRRIEDALVRSAEVEASGVSVTVNDSKVVLEGKARSWAERRAIEHAAWAAPGVARVEDKLVVYY